MIKGLDTQIPNGTFTLVNKATDTHITLRIHTVKSGDLKGKRIISKMNGRDNTRDYQGIAFLNKQDTYSLWARHRTDKNASTISILLAMIIKGKESRFSDRVEIKESRKCLRCNRKLTNPQSVEDGIGPECIQKI
jgi:hypothetical protein